MFVNNISFIQFYSKRPLSLTLSPKEKENAAAHFTRFALFSHLTKVPLLGRGIEGEVEFKKYISNNSL
jgi:hypothetical protein